MRSPCLLLFFATIACKPQTTGTAASQGTQETQGVITDTDATLAVGEINGVFADLLLDAPATPARYASDPVMLPCDSGTGTATKTLSDTTSDETRTVIRSVELVLERCARGERTVSGKTSRVLTVVQTGSTSTRTLELDGTITFVGPNASGEFTFTALKVVTTVVLDSEDAHVDTVVSGSFTVGGRTYQIDQTRSVDITYEGCVVAGDTDSLLAAAGQCAPPGNERCPVRPLLAAPANGYFDYFDYSTTTPATPRPNSENGYLAKMCESAAGCSDPKAGGYADGVNQPTAPYVYQDDDDQHTTFAIAPKLPAPPARVPMRLLVFLPGIAAGQGSYQAFTDRAKLYGYHIIRMHWWNHHAIQYEVGCDDKAPSFVHDLITAGIDTSHGKITTGNTYESKTTCDRVDFLMNASCPNGGTETAGFGFFDGSQVLPFDAREAIIPRLRTILTSLATKFPGQGWERYINLCNGTILWPNVTIAGHSQGATHAAYIARTHRVNRAILFDGPGSSRDLAESADFPGCGGAIAPNSGGKPPFWIRDNAFNGKGGDPWKTDRASDIYAMYGAYEWHYMLRSNRHQAVFGPAGMNIDGAAPFIVDGYATADIPWIDPTTRASRHVVVTCASAGNEPHSRYPWGNPTAATAADFFNSPHTIPATGSGSCATVPPTYAPAGYEACMALAPNALAKSCKGPGQGVKYPRLDEPGGAFNPLLVRVWDYFLQNPGSHCGDGILSPGEACDDRNVINGDGCDASCGIEL